MKLIVGLGNPGKEYTLTRHNVGFMVVEELARENRIEFGARHRFKARTTVGKIGGEDCCLAMPQTFMNLSGSSVRSIANFFKIKLDEILLIMDDIALPFGKVRIKPKGSSAGHKGLRSVIDCLGTEGLPRIRIGIMGRKNIKDY
ncbi:aminoacyl-tRNA hydrolase, partial [Candidatus Omnitrophota bacterium]